MEFVDPVVRQYLGLQLSGARERVAVDFEHLCLRHGIGRRIEVGGIGEQEFQRVANATVGVDDAREDLVVAGDVARVVARGDPQPDDFGAELLRCFLRIDAVALALAHLAALAVDGEPVRQQAPVGCAAVHRAGGQQRGMEPAAVLVVAFEIEVGLGPGSAGARVGFGVRAAGVRAFENGGVRRSRVKPDLQDVAALGVVARVVGAEYRLDAGLAPGLDACGFDHVGRLIEDLHRPGVQLARVLVDEEGQRNAPTALAADAPVGPAADHVAQARLAVFRIEGGLLDRVERELAQRRGRLVLGEDANAFVHADEPLRRGAVDHRRLVTPAVWVAVADGGRRQQPVRFAQHLDNPRAGFPDVHAAKQRQFCGVLAVALDRVEDLVDAHAVRNAAVEVFDPIGRRRVDQTGAVGGGGVVGQIDRGQSVVARVHMRQRMAEVQPA